MRSTEADIELVKRFPVAPREVFAAFAEVRTLSRWLSPSPDVGLTLLQFDFRVGGRYRFAYRLADGATVIVGGSYLTIDPPSDLVFSWTWEPPDEHAGIESRVSILIAPDGAGATLTLRHEHLGRADSIARHIEGWTGAIARLSAILPGPVSDGL
jgi:uncharacterized protein YndB with AHSA1/START domain